MYTTPFLVAGCLLAGMLATPLRAEPTSAVDSGSMTILINLDHSVESTALRASGIEGLGFRRLSYEVAFSEYAMALGYEMAQQDPDMPADDLLFEVRSTLNRVSKAVASLYAA